MCNLHQAIQQIYTLQSLDTFGINALAIVNRLVPGEFPEFSLTNMRTRQVSPIFLPDFPGFSLEMQKTIARHFCEHPIAQNMPQALAGAHKLSDFISQKELHRCEGVYQQFLRLLGTEDQMVLFLPTTKFGGWGQLSQRDKLLVGFSLHRPQRNFTERDRSVLNLLRPHLAQAYANTKQYQQLQQELTQVQQSLNHLGVIILDDEWRIKSIAPQAIIWLEAYFEGFTCTTQLPDNLRSWAKYQITNLVQKTDLPKNCLPLRIQQGGRELTIRSIVEPNAAQYLLLCEEKTLSCLDSLALLGLSQRETEVLALVIQGKDNKAIASQLSVNLSTVCKHLEHIYTKFGVKSRTEAISCALAKLGFF